MQFQQQLLNTHTHTQDECARVQLDAKRLFFFDQRVLILQTTPFHRLPLSVSFFSFQSHSWIWLCDDRFPLDASSSLTRNFRAPLVRFEGIGSTHSSPPLLIIAFFPFGSQIEIPPVGPRRGLSISPVFKLTGACFAAVLSTSFGSTGYKSRSDSNQLYQSWPSLVQAYTPALARTHTYFRAESSESNNFISVAHFAIIHSSISIGLLLID